MRYFKIIFINLLLFISIKAFSHNPEDFIIAEIEQGQINFENDQIYQEYKEALKRQRIRRLGAMSLQKKSLIFIKSGFQHIIPKGLDHILFVLGLFFSCLKFRSLLILVTTFTIAHSITLILAGIGWIRLQGDVIEPLIALSIVWIAIENCIYKKSSRFRFLIVFVFGLLHGMGFASVLNHYGIPKDNFLQLLLSFNIGVEIGQLSIIILAFLLTKSILRQDYKIDKIKVPISIIIGIIGMFWFIERVFDI